MIKRRKPRKIEGQTVLGHIQTSLGLTLGARGNDAKIAAQSLLQTLNGAGALTDETVRDYPRLLLQPEDRHPTGAGSAAAPARYYAVRGTAYGVDAGRMVTVKEINAVLRRLAKKHGIFTYTRRKDIPCCQSCGCAGVPGEYGRRYVFYNMQSVDGRAVGKGGGLHAAVGLTWGEEVDFKEVRSAFADAGIAVTGGDRRKKLEIRPERTAARA